MYKLSFLLHSLLDNGAKMTPKRCSVFSHIFIVNCISKFNLIRIEIFLLKLPIQSVCPKMSPKRTTDKEKAKKRSSQA